jgi:hypothetical protein
MVKESKDILTKTGERTIYELTAIRFDLTNFRFKLGNSDFEKGLNFTKSVFKFTGILLDGGMTIPLSGKLRDFENLLNLDGFSFSLNEEPRRRAAGYLVQSSTLSLRRDVVDCILSLDFAHNSLSSARCHVYQPC